MSKVIVLNRCSKYVNHLLRRSLPLLYLMLSMFYSPHEVQSADQLVIAVSQTPLSLPIYIADTLGYFAAEGLKVKLVEVVGGHRSMQMLLDGRAELATSSEAVVMFNSFKSSKFRVIASFVVSDDDVRIISSSESGISRPRQLAGKRIGTVTGAASQYYLETYLLLNGINPKGVKIVNIQPESMVAALKNGEVDAVSIWEPFPFKITKALPGSKTLPKSGAYRLSFNLLVHKQLTGLRDDDLVKVLRAVERAEQYINAQPQKAMAVLRDRLKLDQEFIDWIWTRYIYRLTLDQSLLTTLESEARWARQEGLVKAERSPNYLDFFYTAPLKRINPSAVSIIR